MYGKGEPLRRPALPLAACLLVCAPRSARAEEPATSTVGLDANPIARPHTMAILEAGIIVLPTAPISQGHRGGDTPFGTIGKGDATLQTGMHFLFRGGRDWAIGAGALFGPRPTSDNTYGTVFARTHSRSYLQLGTEGRYIPLHFKTIEGWLGVTVGGVIIADRYVTNAGDALPAILGTKEVTIRSEGFSFGAQLGFDWMFAERLVAGFAARFDRWLLPSIAKCSPIGDCSTLSGQVEAIELGLKIGYRLPL